MPQKPPHLHQHLHSQTSAAHLRHPPNHHTPATAKGKQKHLQPPETPQKNTTATTPAEKQPVKTEADIAILVDSNGKFLQGEKLLCPKTGDALRIVSDSSFGTPSHIIIHTGTTTWEGNRRELGSWSAE